MQISETQEWHEAFWKVQNFWVLVLTLAATSSASCCLSYSLCNMGRAPPLALFQLSS